MNMQNPTLIVLSPVYNDWYSYKTLVKKCETVLEANDFTNYRFIAVDDSSTERFQEADGFELRESVNEVIELSRNLGHQKAIAIGLAYSQHTYPGSDVVVMDSDGEDIPEHIVELIREGQKTNRIVFAKRKQRSEGPFFALFYRIYKLLFYYLTGRVIDFGNFSFIPGNVLVKVVGLSEIWNHYAVGIVRAKLPFNKVLLDRGTRYGGKSKMSFSSLIMHGLSAISVYSDVVATRLIIVSLLSIFIALIGIGIIFFVRVFTDLAIPGWATSMILGLIIIIFQAFFMAFFMAFLVLSNRSQDGFIPAKGYSYFISKVHK